MFVRTDSMAPLRPSIILVDTLVADTDREPLRTWAQKIAFVVLLPLILLALVLTCVPLPAASSLFCARQANTFPCLARWMPGAIAIATPLFAFAIVAVARNSIGTTTCYPLQLDYPSVLKLNCVLLVNPRIKIAIWLNSGPNRFAEYRLLKYQFNHKICTSFYSQINILVVITNTIS
jgi:hypothetical protein